MDSPSLPRLQPAPCHAPLHRALRASSVWAGYRTPPVICPGVVRWPRRRSPASRPAPPPFGPPTPPPRKEPPHGPRPPRPYAVPSRAAPACSATSSALGCSLRSQAAAAPAQAPRDQGKGQPGLTSCMLATPKARCRSRAADAAPVPPRTHPLLAFPPITMRRPSNCPCVPPGAQGTPPHPDSSTRVWRLLHHRQLRSWSALGALHQETRFASTHQQVL